jgi:hypothetical protein
MDASLERIREVVALLGEIEGLADVESRNVLRAHVLATLETTTAPNYQHVSPRTQLAEPFSKRLRVRAKTITPRDQSATARILAIVDTFQEGITATELDDLLDENMRGSASKVLSRTWAAGKLRREVVSAHASNNARRDLYRYYPPTSDRGIASRI